MTDSALTLKEPTTDPDYRAAIQLLHAEIALLNQKMAKDRTEITRLKSETDLLKVETRAILASLGTTV